MSLFPVLAEADALPTSPVPTASITADPHTRPYFVWRRTQLLRLATIGQRISRTAAADCPGGLEPFGLVLAQAAQFAPAERANAGLPPADSRPIVLGVVAQSPADRARIEAGDTLDLWPANREFTTKLPTFAGVEAAATALDDAAAFAEIVVPVVRGGRVQTHIVRRESGCGGWFDLRQSGRLDAVSTSRWIQVSEALMQRIPSDDELAFVVGHEMGHRVMRRQSGSGRKSCGQSCEERADDMALRYMAAAGYHPAAAVTALRTIAADSQWIDAISGRKGALLRRIARLESQAHSPATPSATAIPIRNSPLAAPSESTGTSGLATGR